jgi:hypothetical protein
MSKQKALDIMQKLSKFEASKKEKLGRRSELEITVKALKALFDYVHGIRQAAGITNQQLSQSAKDGLQQLQDIAQLLQDIKDAKELLDSEIDAIEAATYEPDPIEPQPEPLPPAPEDAS